MKIAPLAEVKAHFSSYVEECEQGPVVVTKNGRPKAVLVAAGNEENSSGWFLPTRRNLWRC